MPDDTKLPPPSGDSQRAQGYVDQLIPLISNSKLRVNHTDLSKFDPSSLHDHYSLDLDEYQIEISHTKQPTTGRDSYVILFNNIKDITQGNTQKEILAYLIITEDQFKKLKDVADEQIETLKKVEEEKRFKVAMSPVDTLIDKISKGEVDVSKSPQPIPDIPKEEPEDTNKEFTDTQPKDIDQPTPAQKVTRRETLHTDPVAIEPRGGPQATQTDQEEPSSFETPPPPIKSVSALAAAAAIPIIEESPEPTSPHISTPGSTLTPSTSYTSQTSSPPPLAEVLPTWPAAPDQPMAAPAMQTEYIPQNEPTSPPDAVTPAPATAPTSTIEEVQAALKKAYEQSPQQPIPKEYRPDLGQVSQPTNMPPSPFDPAVSASTPNLPIQPNPQIDQQIDQAFKPTNNFVLTHDSKTPDV